ncbi:C-C motif chemokine 2-like [Etheostoma cragini]|uniref:C-C motif chemokine 2-like n=1 Tax=Etheostoma cragini TaxID=417921 RepID=UPI00155E8725|nr:C-C motif chemokine 2-like [Etheostoma cragini]
MLILQAACVGGLKEDLKQRRMHHICLSRTNAMTSLAFVSLLLVAGMMSTASAQGGIGSCCRQNTNTQIHRDNLKSYYKQYKSSCPINAVVFTTLKNIRICSNPKTMWTQTSMAYLDGKNWQIQHIISQKHRR